QAAQAFHLLPPCHRPRISPIGRASPAPMAVRIPLPFRPIRVIDGMTAGKEPPNVDRLADLGKHTSSARQNASGRSCDSRLMTPYFWPLAGALIGGDRARRTERRGILDPKAYYSCATFV